MLERCKPVCKRPILFLNWKFVILFRDCKMAPTQYLKRNVQSLKQKIENYHTKIHIIQEKENCNIKIKKIIYPRIVIGNWPSFIFEVEIRNFVLSRVARWQYTTFNILQNKPLDKLETEHYHIKIKRFALLE